MLWRTLLTTLKWPPYPEHHTLLLRPAPLLPRPSSVCTRRCFFAPARTPIPPFTDRPAHPQDEFQYCYSHEKQQHVQNDTVTLHKRYAQDHKVGRGTRTSGAPDSAVRMHATPHCQNVRQYDVA